MTSNNTAEALAEALKFFEEGCVGALPEDPYLAQVWGMAGSHAIIMKGGLSVYEKAPTVPKEKHVDFVGYALQWAYSLIHHHDYEEETLLPLLGPKFESNMEIIKQEHHSFLADLTTLVEYLVSCLPSGTAYGYDKVAPTHEQKEFDGEHLRTLFDAFVHPLIDHLKHELTFLTPEKLKEADVTLEQLQTIRDTHVKLMRSMPKSTFSAYHFLHAPKNSDFPPAPTLVKKFIIPYVASLPNRSLWQFVPN